MVNALQTKLRFTLRYLGKYLLVLDDVFVCGQQHVELPAAQLWHKSAAQARSALETETKGNVSVRPLS